MLNSALMLSGYVAGICVGNRGLFTADFPVGFSEIDDICAVIDRADEIRATQSVVKNQRSSMLMAALNIGHIAASGFHVLSDRSGILLHGIFDLATIRLLPSLPWSELADRTSQ